MNKTVLERDSLSHHCMNPTKSSSARAVGHPNVVDKDQEVHPDSPVSAWRRGDGWGLQAGFQVQGGGDGHGLRDHEGNLWNIYERKYLCN